MKDTTRFPPAKRSRKSLVSLRAHTHKRTATSNSSRAIWASLAFPCIYAPFNGRDDCNKVVTLTTGMVLTISAQSTCMRKHMCMHFMYAPASRSPTTCVYVCLSVSVHLYIQNTVTFLHCKCFHMTAGRLSLSRHERRNTYTYTHAYI